MTKTFKKLTRPLMRKLQPGGKISEHGIDFERLASGDGIFSIGVMVDRQRIHRVIGRESDGTTRTQAEEFIAKVRSDAKHDRLALPKARKVALSFKEAARKYLQRLRETEGKDMKMRTSRLELHLIPFFGETPLAKITSFEIEQYKRQRQEEFNLLRPRGKVVEPSAEKKKKAQPSTINRELAVLSHLFSKATEWDWITQRPAKINRFQEDRGRINYLSAEECDRLIECAKVDSNPQVYPFIVIGLGTGMRRTEILSIRREHIDLQRLTISIPKAKSGAREQPMTKQLRDFLASYLDIVPKGSPWLFPSIAAKLGHTTDIRKPFRRAVAAAGLDPDQVVRHTLRHTAITHLVQAGVDLPTVKRISGHKTLLMVELYAHQNGAHIEGAMDKLQARMQIPA